MKKKIMSLVERQGFILFLFICVCAVAGVTLYLSMKNLNTAKENANMEEVVVVENEIREESSTKDEYSSFEEPLDIGLEEYELKESKQVEELELDEIEKQEVDMADKAVTEEEEEEEEEEEQGQESEEAIPVNANELDKEPKEERDDADVVEEIVASFMPVDGEIMTEYTKDLLVYSDTLESWVGHGGIDIKADEGSAVKAIADGRVKEVYEDKLWGIVIVIDHDNGFQTKYANLQTDKMVEKGLKLAKGDHISKVGKTAKIEMHLEPHLHFEVIKDGKLIDPRSIID